MNKTDLITVVSDKSNLSKASATRAIGCFLEVISRALSSGKKVTISGFGSFSVTQRAVRTGRNPLNGKRISIPACNVVRFKCGKRLRETIK